MKNYFFICLRLAVFLIFKPADFPKTLNLK
jgi:hypothetical protein